VFQLAEKPPADMAQLIAMYKYMPPVVRQRARELLDVISDAVKGYADGSVANPDVMAVEIPVSNGDSPVATAPTVPEVDTVWSKGEG
jgi:exosome complex exonuclease RRP6